MRVAGWGPRTHTCHRVSLLELERAPVPQFRAHLLAMLRAIEQGRHFALTRYASVASIVAAIAMPLWSWLIGYPWPVTVFAAIAGAGVIVLHRANIKRLLHGEESRFTRKRRGGATGANPAAPPR